MSVVRKPLRIRERGVRGWKFFLAAQIAMLLAFAVPVVAEPIASLKPTGYVNDFAGVLSAATQEQLSEMCRQVELQAHAQIAIVTVKSTDGEDIFKYSVELYQKWGIGQKGKDRGVLVLLAAQDHHYFVNVGYGLEPILPDGKVGGFGREAVPLLQQNDYNGAATLLASRVVEVIAKDAGVVIATPLGAAQPTQPNDTVPDQSEPVYRPHSKSLSPGTIILLIIIGIIILFVPPLRRVVFYIILASIFNSGGSRGGGGFGGGGGGFGGFGGGSTGGGGAGGSW